MGEQVKVDLTALTTFAHTLGILADDTNGHGKGTPNLVDMAVGYGTGIKGLAQVIATMGANAKGDFNEYYSFVVYHQQVAESAQQFLLDVLRGITSLGAGAEVCAINYADADQFNAAKLRQLSADMKSGGYAGMDFILHGDATVTSGDVNSAFAPTGRQKLWDPDTKSASTSKAPAPGKGDTTESDKQFQQQVEKDKQLIRDGKASDAKKVNGLDGQPMIIGKGDAAIRVPGDNARGKLPTTAPDKLVTG